MLYWWNSSGVKEDLKLWFPQNSFSNENYKFTALWIKIIAAYQQTAEYVVGRNSSLLKITVKKCWHSVSSERKKVSNLWYPINAPYVTLNERQRSRVLLWDTTFLKALLFFVPWACRLFQRSDFSHHGAGLAGGCRMTSAGYSNLTLSKIIAQEATNGPCPRYWDRVSGWPIHFKWYLVLIHNSFKV